MAKKLKIGAITAPKTTPIAKIKTPRVAKIKTPKV